MLKMYLHPKNERSTSRLSKYSIIDCKLQRDATKQLPHHISGWYSKYKKCEQCTYVPLL